MDIPFSKLVMTLIVVSHRLPIVWHKGEYRDQLRHKAFYSGIASLKFQDISYIGCITDNKDKLISPMKPLPNKMAYVEVDHTAHSDFYNGFCKQVLWQILHYQPYAPQVKEKSYFSAYHEVNQLFVDKIVSLYKPGDYVIVNDYHFLLVPFLLRKAIPGVNIGFFLHSPFPSSELFRCLPQRKALLEGLLGSNMIGFQNYSYARHFLSSCSRVLGIETSPCSVEHDHHVSIGIFPMGINVKFVESHCRRPKVNDKLAKLKLKYMDKIVILGREKLEAHKGIFQKLKGFELFLKTHPEYHEKVILIQLTTSGDQYLESKVNDLIMYINSTYGTAKFNPVRHIHRTLPTDDYYALLRLADIGLITPLRDGMNIASHEFIVSQQEKKAPLILSEFAGTARSLPGAILVNPWNFKGIAEAINGAIVASTEEKQLNHNQMHTQVQRYNCERWASNFVEEMTFACGKFNPVLEIDTIDLVSQFRSSKSRLLILDCDGVSSTQILPILSQLCQQPNIVVYIISERGRSDLDLKFNQLSIGASAENGAFIKYWNTNTWINMTEKPDAVWKQQVNEIFAYYTERTEGSFIELKESAIAWHYQLADPVFGPFQAKECQNHLDNSISGKFPLEILIAKDKLEVRPVTINKGEIVKKILGLHRDCDFVLCIGDDKTDEHMFRVLLHNHSHIKSLFTVLIAKNVKCTSAKWSIGTVDIFMKLLEELSTVN